MRPMLFAAFEHDLFAYLERFSRNMMEESRQLECLACSFRMGSRRNVSFHWYKNEASMTDPCTDINRARDTDRERERIMMRPGERKEIYLRVKKERLTLFLMHFSSFSV